MRKTIIDRLFVGCLLFLMYLNADVTCDKVCKGDMTLNSSNIDSFKNCTIIDGVLIITNTTFTGTGIIPNMDPSELEVFSTVREINGGLHVVASHPNFTDLHYFRNLETIGGIGNPLTLFIEETSLKYLGLISLKKIGGAIYIGNNSNLCFAEGINWSKFVMYSAYFTFFREENNRPKDDCVADNMVCHKECSEDGCWGPSVDDCLSCKKFSLDGTCIDSCSNPGFYQTGNHTCGKCHEECDGTCTGPGPRNCTICKHMKDGPFCVATCPSMKYERDHKCEPCEKNCAGGCTGPGLFIGPGGCDTCHKAIARTNQFIKCLKANELCEEGYYSELVSEMETAMDLKSIAGKEICRKCHPNCEECWGPGLDKCELCRNMKVLLDGNNTNEFNCVDKCPEEKPLVLLDWDGSSFCAASCPTMKYNQYNECLPCNVKCVGGCTGPGDFIGPGGCDTCPNGIVSSDNPNQIICLEEDQQPCEEGYYAELVSVTESADDLKPMGGKLICRKCHPKCKNCTGHGFHLLVCNECTHFRSEEQCEDLCPIEYYTDYATMRCIRCSSDCEGCRGPGSDQCESCRYLKVPIGDNTTHKFNCSDKCPEDKPHSRNDQGEPYCSAIAIDQVDKNSVSAIVGGVLACAFLIGVFVVLFGYQWWQRAKSRKNTARMAAQSAKP